MPNNTVNRIRKLHDKYLNDRKRFDDAKGIVAPIRAVLFRDMTDFTEFLLAYSWMTASSSSVAAYHRISDTLSLAKTLTQIGS